MVNLHCNHSFHNHQRSQLAAALSKSEVFHIESCAKTQDIQWLKKPSMSHSCLDLWLDWHRCGLSSPIQRVHRWQPSAGLVQLHCTLSHLWGCSTLWPPFQSWQRICWCLVWMTWCCQYCGLQCFSHFNWRCCISQRSLNADKQVTYPQLQRHQKGLGLTHLLGVLFQ